MRRMTHVKGGRSYQCKRTRAWKARAWRHYAERCSFTAPRRAEGKAERSGANSNKVNEPQATRQPRPLCEATARAERRQIKQTSGPRADPRGRHAKEPPGPHKKITRSAPKRGFWGTAEARRREKREPGSSWQATKLNARSDSKGIM